MGHIAACHQAVAVTKLKLCNSRGFWSWGVKCTVVQYLWRDFSDSTLVIRLAAAVAPEPQNSHGCSPIALLVVTMLRIFCERNFTQCVLRADLMSHYQQEPPWGQIILLITLTPLVRFWWFFRYQRWWTVQENNFSKKTSPGLIRVKSACNLKKIH